MLNRNRNIWGKKSQLDYFPKSFSPSVDGSNNKETNPGTWGRCMSVFLTALKVLEPQMESESDVESPLEVLRKRLFW